MLKKFIISLIISFLFPYIIEFSPHSAAEAPKQIHSINADIVKETNKESYIVNTYGKAAKEGMVFSITRSLKMKQLSIQLMIRGSDEVILRTEETNVKGRFLKLKETKPLRLVNRWKTEKINLILHPETKYIDVMLLTNSQIKTTLSIKEVKISSADALNP